MNEEQKRKRDYQNICYGAFSSWSPMSKFSLSGDKQFIVITSKFSSCYRMKNGIFHPNRRSVNFHPSGLFSLWGYAFTCIYIIAHLLDHTSLLFRQKMKKRRPHSERQASYDRTFFRPNLGNSSLSYGARIHTILSRDSCFRRHSPQQKDWTL